MIEGMGELITIQRKTVTGLDAHGLPTYGINILKIYNVLVEFNSSTESKDVAITDATSETLKLYLPFGTAIHDSDVFVVRGKEYQKYSVPEYWQSPFSGWDLGVAVKVKAYHG